MMKPNVAIWTCVLLLGVSPALAAEGPSIKTGLEGLKPRVVPVQLPYESPPKPEFPEVPKATPAPKELSPEDMERAEALVPLLSGRQELWAMGEFVHLGKPVVPILTKALKKPEPRLRYNAIETLAMIKDPSAVPALKETALEENEMTRVREHALRVAVRLDPSRMLSTIKQLADDPEATMRKTAAFEARNIRQKEVLPVLIELIPDEQRYVSRTAIESFWYLTRFGGTPHNWENSTAEQRQTWVQEWKDWWEKHKDEITFPERNKASRATG